MKTIPSIILLFAIVACSNPLDKKYSEERFPQDAKAIQQKLDTSETALLMGTVLRYAMEGKKLDGMTYRELLEDGKKYRAEQERIEAEEKALAEKAAREESERIKRLNESLILTVFHKGYHEADYEDYITYKFALQNKTDKDIVAITGTMTFNDLFDKEIKTLRLTYDDGIKANSSVNYSATTDYNQFRDEDELLKSKTLDKIKLVWRPEKIIFKHGTTLE